MAKGPGTTRSGSSGNPTGNGAGAPMPPNMPSPRLQRLAEVYGREAGIDPDDLLYGTVDEFPREALERAIESNTDYDVVGVSGTTINLVNRYGEERDYRNNDPVHVFNVNQTTVVELIEVLLNNSERKLFPNSFK